MLIKKVIVVTFIQIQSSLQGLQMLDMFAVCSYARANTKFKVPVDTIQYQDSVTLVRDFVATLYNGVLYRLVDK